MAFALIQSGSLIFGDVTGNAWLGICNVQGRLSKRFYVANVTQSGAGTTTSYKTGRYFYWLEASGWYDTGSSTFPLPIGTPVTNGPIANISTINLVRRQAIKNVSTAGTAIDSPVFDQGVIDYYGSGRGWLQDTDTIAGGLARLLTQNAASGSATGFVIPIDGTNVDVQGAAVIREMGQNMAFARGGQVPIDFNFAFTGTVTTTGSATPGQATYNFFKATSMKATLVDGNGKTAVGTFLPETMGAAIDYENGLPTRISVTGPITGSLTVS